MPNFDLNSLGWFGEGILAVLAFFYKRDLNRSDKEMEALRSSIQAVNGNIEALEKAQSSHELYVERSFESKTTVKESLDRIHTRIDENNTNVEHKFDQLRSKFDEMLKLLLTQRQVLHDIKEHS